MEVSEGGLTVEVPEERHGASEGSGPGVFYNPVQELNRDVTVGVLRAVADDCGSYLDAMTASGVRAVRAADAGYDVTACDVDEDAVIASRYDPQSSATARSTPTVTSRFSSWTGL